MSQGDQGVIRGVQNKVEAPCPACPTGSLRIQNEISAKPGWQDSKCDNPFCGFELHRPNHGADTQGGKLR